MAEIRSNPKLYMQQQDIFSVQPAAGHIFSPTLRSTDTIAHQIINFDNGGKNTVREDTLTTSLSVGHSVEHPRRRRRCHPTLAEPAPACRCARLGEQWDDEEGSGARRGTIIRRKPRHRGSCRSEPGCNTWRERKDGDGERGASERWEEIATKLSARAGGGNSGWGHTARKSTRFSSPIAWSPLGWALVARFGPFTCTYGAVFVCSACGFGPQVGHGCIWYSGVAVWVFRLPKKFRLSHLIFLQKYCFQIDTPNLTLELNNDKVYHICF
jgi:hypothetical protein